MYPICIKLVLEHGGHLEGIKELLVLEEHQWTKFSLS